MVEKRFCIKTHSLVSINCLSFLFSSHEKRNFLLTGAAVFSIARPTQCFLVIFGKVIQEISVSIVPKPEPLNFKHHLGSTQIRTKTIQMTWVLIIRNHHNTELNCMYWNPEDRFKATRGKKVSQRKYKANVDSKMTSQNGAHESRHFHQ